MAGVTEWIKNIKLETRFVQQSLRYFDDVRMFGCDGTARHEFSRSEEKNTDLWIARSARDCLLQYSW